MIEHGLARAIPHTRTVWSNDPDASLPSGSAARADTLCVWSYSTNTRIPTSSWLFEEMSNIPWTCKDPGRKISLRRGPRSGNFSGFGVLVDIFFSSNPQKVKCVENRIQVRTNFHISHHVLELNIAEFFCRSKKRLEFNEPRSVDKTIGLYPSQLLANIFLKKILIFTLSNIRICRCHKSQTPACGQFYFVQCYIISLDTRGAVFDQYLPTQI
jgi:hypothetical protein